MDVGYDPAKSERNIAERGLSFERAVAFDFETALFAEDTRQDYGEVRWQALGFLDARLHMLVFAEYRTRHPGHPFLQGEQARGEAI